MHGGPVGWGLMGCCHKLCCRSRSVGLGYAVAKSCHQRETGSRSLSRNVETVDGVWCAMVASYHDFQRPSQMRDLGSVPQSLRQAHAQLGQNNRRLHIRPESQEVSTLLDEVACLCLGCWRCWVGGGLSRRAACRRGSSLCRPVSGGFVLLATVYLHGSCLPVSDSTSSTCPQKRVSLW